VKLGDCKIGDLVILEDGTHSVQAQFKGVTLKVEGTTNHSNTEFVKCTNIADPYGVVELFYKDRDARYAMPSVDVESSIPVESVPTEPVYKYDMLFSSSLVASHITKHVREGWELVSIDPVASGSGYVIFVLMVRWE
jgi:hypothetical protein